MRDPKIKALIDELQTWCKGKYGRNTEIADKLGVPRQSVSDWFSERTVPTLSTGLKIQEFLESQRRKTKAKGKKT